MEDGDLAGRGSRRTDEPQTSLEIRIVQESGLRSWLLIGQMGFAPRIVLMAPGKVFGRLGADA